MESVKIVLTALAAGIGYGIVHDQITVRVCVEYFTIGHPALFQTTSPTLLALAWGIAATWWVALPLGFALAVAARLGPQPKYDANRVLRPLLLLLVCMAVIAAAFGVAGYLGVRSGMVSVDPWVMTNIAASKQAAFIGNWWAHSASYLSGTAGGLILCIYVWRTRRKAHIA